MSASTVQVFRVPDIVCEQNCGRKVCEAVRSLPGVEQVRLTFAARLLYVSGSRVESASIFHAIAATEFHAELAADSPIVVAYRPISTSIDVDSFPADNIPAHLRLDVDRESQLMWVTYSPSQLELPAEVGTAAQFRINTPRKVQYQLTVDSIPAEMSREHVLDLCKSIAAVVDAKFDNDLLVVDMYALSVHAVISTLLQSEISADLYEPESSAATVVAPSENAYALPVVPSSNAVAISGTDGEAKVFYEIVGMRCQKGCANYVQSQIVDAHLRGVVGGSCKFDTGLLELSVIPSEIPSNIDDLVSSIVVDAGYVSHRCVIIDTLEFSVTGMHCQGGCANKVARAVRSLKSVVSADCTVVNNQLTATIAAANAEAVAIVAETIVATVSELEYEATLRSSVVASVYYQISGMRCQNGCANYVKKEVIAANIPGVRAVDCRVSTKLLSLEVDCCAVPSDLDRQILQLVSDAEYEATKCRYIDSVEFAVSGMHCQNGCANKVAAAVACLPNVASASCSIETEQLVVKVAAPDASCMRKIISEVVSTVKETGYETTHELLQSSSTTAVDAVPNAIIPSSSTCDQSSLHSAQNDPKGIYHVEQESDDVNVSSKKADKVSLLPKEGMKSKSKDKTKRKMAADNSDDSADEGSSVAVGAFYSMFRVTGMTCASCAATITKALSPLPGVISVDVVVLMDKATVYHDPAIASADSIAAVIRDAGYSCEFMTDAQQELDKKLGGVSNHHVFLVNNFTCVKCPLSVHFAFTTADPHHIVSVLFAPVAVMSPPSEHNQEQSVKELPARKLSDAAFTIPARWRITVNVKSGGIGARTMLALLKKLGYDAELVKNDENAALRESLLRKHEIMAWRSRFWQSLIFTVPVVLLAMSLMFIPGAFDNHDFYLAAGFIQWILTSPVLFYSGSIFHQNAYKAVRAGSATMDVLVSLGTLAAYCVSVFSIIYALADTEYRGDFYFETAAALISFLLLGKYLENVAKGRSSAALVKLLDLKPPTCSLVVQASGKAGFDEVVELDAALLEYGDIVRVRAGEKMACDGVVVEGQAQVDESMLTGESAPVAKTVGSTVTGGTLLTEGVLFISATRLGADSTIAQMVALMEKAQAQKAPLQKLADRISARFVPAILAVTLVVFFIWLALGYSDSYPSMWRNGLSPWLFALLISISVLVVACPCALGLATPTAILVGTGVGASFGVLIKGGEPLEHAAKASIITFDKTGTLTFGNLTVDRYECFDKTVENLALARIRALESRSEHAIAAAIVRHLDASLNAAGSDSVVAGEVASFETHPGMGVVGTFSDGARLIIGTERFLSEVHKLTISEDVRRALSSFAASGLTMVLVAVNDSMFCVFGLGDTVRPDAVAAVGYLQQKLHMQVYMVSGDNPAAAGRIADIVGIPDQHVIAGVLPEGKIDAVRHLQEFGRVIHVGDGINDAPAMLQAHLGIAVAAGTDVAMEAAGVVLMKNALWDVVVAIHLARAVVRRIKLNYCWAMGYNIIAVPIAAGILFPAIGMMVPPVAAGAAMVCSSLSVLLSSLHLKRYAKPQIKDIVLDQDRGYAAMTRV